MNSVISTRGTRLPLIPLFLTNDPLEKMDVMAEIPVEIWQMMRDDEGHDIVFLRDAQGQLLPIAIGPCEAAAIWVRLAPELAAPFVRRPWTHDLLAEMLERMGVTLARVVIDNLDAAGTFYATLHLDDHGREVLADARPSDVLALLLRIPAPLSVEESVMAEAGVLPDARGHDEEEDGDMGFEDWP